MRATDDPLDANYREMAGMAAMMANRTIPPLSARIDVLEGEAGEQVARICVSSMGCVMGPL